MIFMIAINLVLLAVGVATIFIWSRKRQHAGQARPDGEALAAVGQADDMQTPGTLMLVASGTPGASQAAVTLAVLDLSGCAGAVGGALIIEPDSDSRARARASIPVSFRDRLICERLEHFPGGGANCPLETLYANAVYWRSDVTGWANTALDKFRSRNGSDPSVLLTLISPGTSGAMGAEAVEEILARSAFLKPVGVLTLPKDEHLRRRVPDIIAAYVAAGLHGFILLDNHPDKANRERNAEAVDLAIASLLLGLVAARDVSQSQHREDLNNIFNKCLPGGDGFGLASLKLATEYRHWRMREKPMSTTQQDWPNQDRWRYVTQTEAIQLALQTIKMLERPQSRLLPAPYGVPGTSVLDVLLMPIIPPHALAIEDEVRKKLADDPSYPQNHHLIFAPISTNDQENCHFTAVRLQGIPMPEAVITELSKSFGDAWADRYPGSGGVVTHDSPNSNGKATLELEAIGR